MQFGEPILEMNMNLTVKTCLQLISYLGDQKSLSRTYIEKLNRENK